MLTCVDCKNCKDVSTNPYVIKLYCTVAKSEITDSSIVMIVGADECLEFQQKSTMYYKLLEYNMDCRK
jgi:hypothetical protein